MRIFILFSLLLFSASLAAMKLPPDGFCPDHIDFTMTDDDQYTFSIEGIGEGQMVSWNFGDGSETSVYGGSASHVFMQGVYQVVATFTDEDCLGQVILQLDITVDDCYLTLSYVETTTGLFTITAQGYPEKYPMYWDMGDGTTIVETWVVDHFFEPGTYEVCAYVVSDFCADTLRACVELNYDPTSTDASHSEKIQWCLYPNPASDVLFISGGNDLKRMVIHAVDGAIVLDCGMTKGMRALSLETLSNGIYFAECYTSTSRSVLRFVISK